MMKESTREKREDGKQCRSESADLLDTLGLRKRPHQTKLEAMICQKIPAASLYHPEVTFVLDLGGSQPGAVALCQLRSELMLEGWIK